MNLRPTPWVEPPHPSAIHLYQDLIQVYRSMKENQREIDQVFDRVASQIGFVVTTTLPVHMEVESNGSVRSFEPASEAVRNTLFEAEFKPFLEQFKDRTLQDVSPGKYRFYLIWLDALLYKLAIEANEPPHAFASLIGALAEREQVVGAAVRPEVMEPVHWFDPRVPLPVEDVLTISAIDIVYPELRLAERVSANRMAVRAWGSHPQERVHVPAYVKEPVHYLQSLVRPEVQEPAHPPGLTSRENLLAELRAVLQKYGM